eukprot:EG_transcript_3035
MSVSGSSTLQRAGSFGRRSSWQLDPARLSAILFLETTDVDRMAAFSLSVGQIVQSEGTGDVAPLQRLLGEVQHLHDQYNQNMLLPLAVAKVSRRVGTALNALDSTPAAMDPVPLQPVHELLKAVETIAGHAEAADARRRQAAAEYDLLAQQITSSPKSRVGCRVNGDLLPGTLQEADRYREGWAEDAWWQAAGRQQTVEALEARWQAWLQADERTDALCGTRAQLKDAILAVEAQLRAVSDVQALRAHQPPQSPDTAGAYDAAGREWLGRRDAARRDARVVERLQQGLEQRNAEAIMAYAQSATYLDRFRADCQRRRDEVERQLEELDLWRQKETFRIEDAGEPHSDVIDPLQEEVQRLRQQLQEKEERLAREVDLWRQAHGEATRRKVHGLRRQFEERYAAELAKRAARRELLVDEDARAEAEAQRRAAREAERRAEAEAALQRLAARQAALERTAKAYSDLSLATDMSRELWQELHKTVAQYFDAHLTEEAEPVRRLQTTGLGDGGRLCALLETISGTLTDRLAAADKTVQHLNTLLEFNVDTYDPYAYRIKSVLDDVLDMRRRLQEELSDNAKVSGWLREHLNPILKAYLADKFAPAGPLKQLRTMYPGLFELLDKEEPKKVETMETVVTPRSPYVSPSRKPFPPLDSPPTSPFKGTAAPHSPLPWVQTRRWQLPDDTELALGTSTASLGATWPAPQPSSIHSSYFGSPTLSSSFKLVPPATSTNRFDHRDFHLYKTLK